MGSTSFSLERGGSALTLEDSRVGSLVDSMFPHSVTEQEACVDNPFIAEVCEHYPERFAVGHPVTRRERDGHERPLRNCVCADCFYCDGEDDE